MSACVPTGHPDPARSLATLEATPPTLPATSSRTQLGPPVRGLASGMRSRTIWQWCPASWMRCRQAPAVAVTVRRDSSHPTGADLVMLKCSC